MHCLLRRDYEAATLVREHPPKLGHGHKQLVYELCSGAATAGPVAVTRWKAEPLPEAVALAPTEIVAMPGHFDYAGDHRGVWHVNFADPDLFFGYGTSLFAQDEIQAAEHPVLGSIREALGADALTMAGDDPTPVLVAGVERRCTVETAPAPGRPGGLYGNRFAAAPLEVVRAAVRVHRPPPRSNLIAIAAPTQGRGVYTRATIDQIVLTAYSGFAAAIAETARLWPGAHTEIRTGFWGCGAFGGNRQLLAMLQLLAARLAGVTRLAFYAFDDRGAHDFAAGAAALERVLAEPAATLDEVLARIVALGYRWGHGDGN